MKKQQKAVKGKGTPATEAPTPIEKPAPVIPAPAAKKLTELKQTSANPFEKIGERLATVALGISELDDIGTIEGMADAIDAMEKAIPKTQESVKNSVFLLFEANKYIVAAKNQDAELKSQGKTAVRERIAKEVAAKYTVKAEACIAKVLGYTGVLLAVGVLEYIKTAMSLVPESYEQGLAVLKDLQNRNILVTSGTGPVIRIAYLKFYLGNFGFEPDDVKQISAAVDQFDRKQTTLLHEQRRQVAEKMQDEKQITLDEALNGKPGKVFLRVPAECFVRDGKDHWEGGGNVMFEFSRDGIKAVGATGKAEKSVKEAASLGVKIEWHMLDWGCEFETDVKQYKIVGNKLVENGTRKGTKKVPVPIAGELMSDVANDLNMSYDEALQYAKKLMAVWHMLDRGINEVAKLKEQAEAKETMAAKAQTGMFELFGLNGLEGQGKPALLQMDGVYKMPRENLFNPFFLAERNGDNVTVVEVPPHLNALLGEFVGKEFPMAECPGELGGMMRRILSQQEMAARVVEPSVKEDASIESEAESTPATESATTVAA